MGTKQLLLLTIAFLLSLTAKSQTVKKTFYDLNGTKPKEVYSVNAQGEKNGSYKSYYEDGLLAVESNYKNGNLDGLYKEYQWLGSKIALKKTETYKDGVRNGPAVVYGGPDLSVKVQQGNYVNDKKDGVWKVTEETSASMSEGFRFFTYTQTFKNGELLEESETWLYFPSGKTFAKKVNGVRTSFSPDGKKTGEETYNSNGELMEEKFFYLNGAMAEHNKYSIEGGKKIVEENAWYEDGKVKKKSKTSDGSPVYYEGYKPDGSKDDNMLNAEKNANRIAETYDRQRAQCKKLRSEGDNYIASGKTDDATSSFKYLKDYSKKNIEDNKSFYKDTVNFALFQSSIAYAEKKLAEIESSGDAQQKVKTQRGEIVSKYQTFKKTFAVKTPGETEISYPKGEVLFMKADSRIKVLEEAYNSEIDPVKKLEAGAKMISALDKVLSLKDVDTKDMEKKLKKAKTIDEENVILGF